MPVDLDTLAALSRAVVNEQRPGLDVVTVTTTEGGIARAEVLVTIAGCHTEPCRFLINVSRADDAQFEREFRSKLREALRKHP
jgi:hypothetical protein